MPDLKGYTADQILNMYNKISLDIYLEMGIVDKKTYESVKDDDRKRQELLSNIKTPEGKEANVFAEKFVRKAIDIDNQENTNGVYFENLGTSLLAKAYNELKRILKDEDNKLSAEDREYYERTQNKVTERIDTLIHDLANQVGYHLVFQETIADCYSGYLEMFEARAADLKPNDKLHKEIEKGKQTILDPMITEYDKNVGISNLGASAKDAKTIEKNYDNALKVAYDWKPDEKTLKDVSQYHFLDENGQAQAQFRDDAGNEHTTYEKGDEVIPDRELSEVMNLARSNFAIQNSCDETIDDKTEAQINKELNQELLSTLYECDKASKGAEISWQRPSEQEIQDFVNSFSSTGGSITPEGLDMAKDAQVNRIAGFADRVKHKLGKFKEKASNFFGKIFNPIRKSDKLAAGRLQPQKDKRQTRIEFFVRMLKGFGCAFAVSALITTIATAAAATAGVSLAASLAAVGIIAGIGMTLWQIHKWKQAQPANKRTIQDFLKDPQMRRTVTTTTLAAIALGFGAAGFITAAQVLGLGALGLGASNNAITTYKSAKARGLSTKESIGWAIGNALAVVLGGFAGRGAAHMATNAYNVANETNTISQTENHHTEVQQVGEVVRHEVVYNPDGQINMEATAHKWADPQTLDNWTKMVDEYNANPAHELKIDPYTSYVMSADAGMHADDNILLHNQYGPDVHSGGNHTTMVKGWADYQNFPMEQVHELANMGTDGHISDAEANAYFDIIRGGHLHTDNSLSYFPNRNVFTDNVLHNNSTVQPTDVNVNHAQNPDGTPVYSSWTQEGTPIAEIKEITEPIYQEVDVPTYESSYNGAMAAFGNYFQDKNTAKDRPNSQARKPEEQVEPPVPPIIDIPEDEDTTEHGSEDEGTTKEPPVEPVPPIIDIPEDEGTTKEPPVEPVPPIIDIPEDEGTTKEPPVEPVPPIIDIPEGEGPTGTKPTKQQWGPGVSGGSDLYELYPDLWQEKPETKEKQEEYTDAPKYLRISRADAEDITVKQQRLANKRQDWKNPKIQGKARKKLGIEIETLRRDLNHRLNEIGNPDQNTLDDAMYWAFRKEDLEKAQTELAKEELFKVTGGTSRHRIQEHEQNLAYWRNKIKEYKDEIPDESMFYDPVRVQYNKEAGKKIPVTESAQKTNSESMNTLKNENEKLKEANKKLLEALNEARKNTSLNNNDLTIERLKLWGQDHNVA